MNDYNKFGMLISEIDAAYHEAAVRLNISDSVLKILYVVQMNEGKCLLSELSRESGISRKTIHSAVQNLAKKGIITFENYNDKSKYVILTELGKDMVNKKILPVMQMEQDLFSLWTDEERSMCLTLMERYLKGMTDITSSLK